MRALILSVSDKRHMSMSVFYEDYFESRNIPYDIICINRYKTGRFREKTRGGYRYEYGMQQSTDEPKIKKVSLFLRFRSFAIRLLNKNKYDYIVVWNENTAVVFGDILTRKFNGRYCVNIRDKFEITCLSKQFFRVINQANFATTPSMSSIKDEFRDCKHIVTLYNKDTEVEKHVEKKYSLKHSGEPIVITYMGLYSAVGENFKTLVDMFGNDKRFELHFYGDGFDTILQDYVDSKGISNVVTGGPFPYEKTFEYLENTDIINGFYFNSQGNPQLHRNMAGVKQSYTPLLYIPGLVDDDTNWGNICKKYGFGFCVNNENYSDLADNLYNWYRRLDMEKLKQGCDEFKEVIEQSRNTVTFLMDSAIGMIII